MFEGTAEDRSRFLNLWSEAELVNLDTKLLTAFQNQLPGLKLDLENHVEYVLCEGFKRDFAWFIAQLRCVGH